MYIRHSLRTKISPSAQLGIHSYLSTNLQLQAAAFRPASSSVPAFLSGCFLDSSLNGLSVWVSILHNNIHMLNTTTHVSPISKSFCTTKLPLTSFANDTASGLASSAQITENACCPWCRHHGNTKCGASFDNFEEVLQPSDFLLG